MTPLPRPSTSPRPRRSTMLGAVEFAVAAGAMAAPAERGSARQDPGDVGSLSSDVLSCDVYPDAVPVSRLTGIEVGTELLNTAHGTQPGAFGWLSWTGAVSIGPLVLNLTPPGDSGLFVNARNSDDHPLSQGDWVSGRPGVANADDVLTALDVLFAGTLEDR